MEKTTASTLSDKILVEQYLKTQSNEYYQQLYSRYAPKVFAKCIALLKNEAAAKDAMQDIFIKIFIKLSSFKGTARFSTWVYSITYNYCIDVIRKRKKYATVFTEHLENLELHSEEIPDNSLLEIRVERLKIILDKIPAKDKAILLMKYQQEMPIKEIAAILNKSESATKMQLKRAKLKTLKVHQALYKDKISG